MNKLIKKLENLFSTAAFAEAGEFEAARQIIKGKQKVLVAVTGRYIGRKASDMR